MSEVTRDEFNGLGKRVSSLKESFVGCQSGNQVKIENLEKMATTSSENQTKIFEKLEALEVKVSSQWAKVTAGVVVGWAVVQVVIKFIPIGK